MNFFRATVDDVDRIERCARDCCAEHGEVVTGGALDWPFYRDSWRALIASGHGAMFLYSSIGEIVAGIGGHKYQEMLTGKWRAKQIFVYVRPEFRGACSFARMTHALETWALEQGCRSVLQPMLPSMPKRTTAFYEREGYREAQTLFVKEL